MFNAYLSLAILGVLEQCQKDETGNTVPAMYKCHWSGPVFLGGCGYHSDDPRTSMAFDIYNQYLIYRRLIGTNFLYEERYHNL